MHIYNDIWTQSASDANSVCQKCAEECLFFVTWAVNYVLMGAVV